MVLRGVVFAPHSFGRFDHEIHLRPLVARRGIAGYASSSLCVPRGGGAGVMALVPIAVYGWFFGPLRTWSLPDSDSYMTYLSCRVYSIPCKSFCKSSSQSCRRVNETARDENRAGRTARWEMYSCMSAMSNVGGRCVGRRCTRETRPGRRGRGGGGKRTIAPRPACPVRGGVAGYNV